MYVVPVYFPQTTNREDFLSTVSIFDDDTGQAINLSGTTLANPGSAFTAASWKVVDGSINTTSSTSITIPTFPIGSQLSALVLTVGAGLGILPGDPITISDSATGLNSMTGFVTSYTTSSGSLTVQIGFTFQFEIRGETPNNTGSGYIAWYDFGTPDDQGPILVAGLGNGISITDIGFIQIRFAESVFKTILDVPYNSQSNTYARTFLAALTMTNSVDTRQIFTGRLPVLYGGVTN